MGRINELLIEKPEIVDMPKPGTPQEISGEIEFRNLSYAYNGSKVLRDVNLRIPAGSSLAIVGPTGSGKTTLVNLIARVYDAPPGTVLIDGRPIRDYPLSLAAEHRLRAPGNIPLQ